jgi:hypothetical protein
MTTSKTLEILLSQLATMTNKAASKDEAINKGLNSYLSLDNYPMYGGYNLVSVSVNGGGHSNSFNSFPSCGNRINGKAMIEKIRSFMDGLNFNSNN